MTVLRRLLSALWNRPDLTIPVFLLVGSWIISRNVGLPSWLWGPINLHPGFYAAAAQVFPVLLVALLVEIGTSLDGFRQEIAAARSQVAMAPAKEKEVNKAVYKLEMNRFRGGLAVVTPVAFGEAAAL